MRFYNIGPLVIMSALNRIGLLFGLDRCYKNTILMPLKSQLSTGFTIKLKIRLLSIQIYKLYHYWITKSDWKLYLLSVICYWRHGCTYRRSLVFMVEEEVESWGWWRFRLMLRMLWRCRRRFLGRIFMCWDKFLKI